MPVIVIVLMFLVLFLLAVIAMIVGPFLGVGYALWNLNQKPAQEQCISAFPAIEMENGIESGNTSHRR